jgi:hypothetical protein
MGGILGYARVSTGDQDVTGQTLRLTQAGAIKVFTDVRSGRSMERPGLDALLAFARDGDALAVVRLDRLGRSLGELLATVALLKARGIALVSLEEKIDTASAAGELELVFHVFAFRTTADRRADEGWNRGGPCARQAPWASTPRCGQDCRRAQTGEGRPVANRRCKTTRARAINRLSRGQPGRH